MADIRNLTICLDPGHGGTDPGAVGPTKLKESETNLAIANHVRSRLIDYGAKVVMTRTGDSNPSHLSRVQTAKNNGASIFVSIHCNGSAPEAHGLETWKHDKAGTYSVQLAEAIQRSMVNSTGRANRGIKSAPSERYKQEDIYVLNPNNIGSIWSALPECLFITNPTEEALLKDINYRQRLGHAIAAGINNFVTSLPFQ